MLIRFLLILLTSSSIISCGADNDSGNSDYLSTELTLNYSDDSFTSPSLFTISSNHFYTCVSAVIFSNDISYSLEITSGFGLMNNNETICALSDLPKEIINDSIIEISYRKAEGDAGIITESFTYQPSQINQLNKNSVYNFSNKTYVQYIDHDLTELQLASSDYSGGSSSMQYVFKEKLGMEFTEAEIMRDLLAYGETDAIVARRGFSLLDMKRVFEHYGFTANGFRVPAEEGFDYIENDLSTLQLNTPFISPVNFRGIQVFITIVKITNQAITLLHPHLGYLQIPFTELENGQLRNHEDWVVFIPEFIQE